MFEKYIPFICSGALFTPADLKGAPFTDLMHLQDAGLISGVGGLVQKIFTLSDKGQALLPQQEHLLLIEGPPGYTLSLGAALLTSVGTEVASISKIPFNLKAGAEIAELIPKASLKSISYAGIQSSADGTAFVPIHVLWKAEVQPA